VTMSKKNYLINERNISQYRTNQKEEILQNIELQRSGFPKVWPTRDENNALVFISFVDCYICDSEGNVIDNQVTTFNVLDEERFNPNDPNAENKLKFISALLSPKYKVMGGVYLSGKYYTGQMKYKQAKILYQNFMWKYFYIEDKEAIDKYFERNKLGYFPFWPIKSRTGKKVVFSAVHAYITNKSTNAVHASDVNFNVYKDQDLDFSNPEDKKTILTIFSIFDSNSEVLGCYYKGRLIKKKATKEYKLYLEKTFIKKNFSISAVPQISHLMSRTEDHRIIYFPMHDDNRRSIAISFRDGETPFGEEYKNFDIYADEEFNLNQIKYRNIVNIIENIASFNPEYKGSLYLDGVLISKFLKKKEIEHRIDKTERALRVRLYGDPDYLKMISLFTTDDREKLLMLSRKYENAYPNCPLGESLLPDMSYFSFNKVNILTDSGSFLYEKPYSARYNEPFTPNEIEMNILKEAFKKDSCVSGNLLYYGKDINHKLNLSGFFHPNIRSFTKDLKRTIDKEDFKDIIKNKKIVGSSCNMDKKSKQSLLVGDEIHKPYFIFDRVNILDEHGNYIFKKAYSARYDEPFSPNEIEIKILKEAFKISSYVRGGLYLNGKNINHKFNLARCFHPNISKFIKNLKKVMNPEDFNEMNSNKTVVGVPYKMDKKSKTFVHWPTFDRTGREVLLSTVDSDVWFKVGRNIVKAANNMNFNIFSGETFGLVGESGSGKTTISRAILGINPLHKGGIYWKGKLISSGLSRKEQKNTKKSIQMIFQDPAACLNERANVDYIVSEGLYNFHLYTNKAERLTKVVSMLNNVGLLPEHLSRYPHEFSGGQRQRIGIARALVIEPELVLADEPISALDVSIRAQVLNLLRRLQKENNLTYLFIAHDLSIIRYISDRIAVMHNGYIVELGNAEEIYQNPLHPYTKSLLTAIPQPDPKTKDKRIKITYEQGDIVYGNCYWHEFGNGHYVLVNDDLKAKIDARIAKKGLEVKEVKPIKQKVEESKKESIKKPRAKKVK